MRPDPHVPGASALPEWPFHCPVKGQGSFRSSGELHPRPQDTRLAVPGALLLQSSPGDAPSSDLCTGKLSYLNTSLAGWVEPAVSRMSERSFNRHGDRNNQSNPGREKGKPATTRPLLRKARLLASLL